MTEQGESADDAASAVDYARYLQAFPDLQMYATEPLKVETKIAPGGEAKGSVMVAFPITKEQFYARKDLNVTIFPYDQKAIVLHEKGAAPPQSNTAPELTPIESAEAVLWLRHSGTDLSDKLLLRRDRLGCVLRRAQVSGDAVLVGGEYHDFIQQMVASGVELQRLARPCGPSSRWSCRRRSR